jgi:hypothetical protein
VPGKWQARYGNRWPICVSVTSANHAYHGNDLKDVTLGRYFFLRLIGPRLMHHQMDVAVSHMALVNEPNRSVSHVFTCKSRKQHEPLFWPRVGHVTALQQCHTFSSRLLLLGVPDHLWQLGTWGLRLLARVGSGSHPLWLCTHFANGRAPFHFLDFDLRSLTDTAQTPETSGTCNSRKQLLSLTPLRQWNGWIALDATRPSLL